jgi:hypothetical protein
MALLTMALLTMALLTMALLTMALLTMALLTMALLTMAARLVRQGLRAWIASRPSSRHARARSGEQALPARA